MSYWLAPSLVTLRDEINAVWPKRDKASDGWIGDRRHAGGKSDHNPSQWPPKWEGVVRAYDVDNDLGGSASGLTLWNHLRPMLGVHPALGSGAYLIYNKQIISTDRLREGVRRYTGTNPHTSHIHISVAKAAKGYNSTQAWGISQGDDIMQDTEEQYQIFMKFLYRALRWDVRRAGAGADWKLGPTLWEHIVNEAAATRTAVAGIQIPEGEDIDSAELAQQVADALPDNIAEQVLDLLAERIGGKS